MLSPVHLVVCWLVKRDRMTQNYITVSHETWTESFHFLYHCETFFVISQAIIHES